MSERRVPISGEYVAVPAVRRARAGGHARVAITMDAASDHTLWADLAMDVLKGGIFVATYEALTLGTLVDLEVTLPDSETPLAFTGVVRWTRPHIEGSDGATGVGVKFVELSDNAKNRMLAFAKLREPVIFDLDEAPIRGRRTAA
jgi:uncharacterized protein (TIGR02266 family)